MKTPPSPITFQALALIAAFAFSSAVTAAEIQTSWSGKAGNQWSNKDNWTIPLTPNNTPSDSFGVIFDSSKDNPIAEVTSDTVIDSLEIRGGGIAVKNSDFKVLHDARNSGSISLLSDFSQGPSGEHLYSTFEILGSFAPFTPRRIQPFGSLTIHAIASSLNKSTATFVADSSREASGSIIGKYSIIAEGPGAEAILRVKGSKLTAIVGNSSLEMQGAGSRIFGGSSFDPGIDLSSNRGSLTLSRGASLHSTTSFTNGSDFISDSMKFTLRDGGRFSADKNFYNAGIVDLQSADGVNELNAVEFLNIHTITASSSQSGGNRMVFSGPGRNAGAITLSGPGTSAAFGGKLINSQSSNELLGRLVVNDRATLRAQSLQNSGTLEINKSTLWFEQGISQVDGILGQGTYALTNAELRFGGDLIHTLGPGVSITLDGYSMFSRMDSDAKSLDLKQNAGSLTLSTTASLASTGAFLNAVERETSSQPQPAKLAIRNGATFSTGANLMNFGTVELASTGGKLSKLNVGADFWNYAAFRATSLRLSGGNAINIAGDLVNHGAFEMLNLDPGLAGTSQTLTAARVTNYKTFALAGDGTAAIVNGHFDNSQDSTLTLDDGATLTVASLGNTGTIEILGGASAETRLTVSGGIENLVNGSLDYGTIRVAASPLEKATLNINGSIRAIGAKSTIILDGANARITNSASQSSALGGLSRVDGTLRLAGQSLSPAQGPFVLGNTGTLALGAGGFLRMGSQHTAQFLGDLFMHETGTISYINGFTLGEDSTANLALAYVNDGKIFFDAPSISGSGTVHLDGDLLLTLEGPIPQFAVQEMITLMRATSVTGAFDNVADMGFVDLTSGGSVIGKFQLDYRGSEVVLLNYTPIPEPGTSALCGLALLLLFHSRVRAAGRTTRDPGRRSSSL